MSRSRPGTRYLAGAGVASDVVELTIPELAWLVEWATRAIRATGGTPKDHALLARINERKREVAFKRNNAGPIREGWAALQEVTELTGTPARTWQNRARTGHLNGQPIRAHKLSGWYLHLADIERVDTEDG